MPSDPSTEVRVEDVTVPGPHDPLLGPTSFDAPAAAVTVVTSDPGPGQTALALALGGRVRLTTGHVLLGGIADPDVLRRHVRLIDVPDISEPDPVLSVHAVVAEELALAGQPARRRDVDAVLDEAGLTANRAQRWESQPPGRREALLLRLAARSADAEVLVLTAPDRHGGDPNEWFTAALEVADSGRTVIILCGAPTAELLEIDDTISLGVLK